MQKWDENHIFILHVSSIRSKLHEFLLANITTVQAKSGNRIFNFEQASEGKKLDLLLANFDMIDKSVYWDIIKYVLLADLLSFFVLFIEIILRKSAFMWYLDFNSL